MKKRFAILTVVLVIMLVIPVPSGTYRDGGTKEYTALTYKIVDWNHMTDDGVYDKVKVYPFPMNFFSIDSLLAREEKSFENTEPAESTTGETDTDRSEPLSDPTFEDIDFTAQYIRTDGGNTNTAYPIIRVIRSKAELDAYYEANKDIYTLEGREDIAADSTVGFLDACKRYDEEYFSSRPLVIIVHEEISGSIRHTVDSLTESEDGGLIIDMSADIPEAMTDDMATWHILVEPEANTQVPDRSDITVTLDGKTITDNTSTVLSEHGEASISLQLPCGWEYEQIESANGSYFGIDFWPEGREVRTDRTVSLYFYNHPFGVCGTGLSTEEITIGSYKAKVGRYDGDASWSFIRFTDAPGEFVATRFSGALEGIAEYEDEIMKILESAVLESNVITGVLE